MDVDADLPRPELPFTLVAGRKAIRDVGVTFRHGGGLLLVILVVAPALLQLVRGGDVVSVRTGIGVAVMFLLTFGTFGVGMLCMLLVSTWRITVTDTDLEVRRIRRRTIDRRELGEALYGQWGVTAGAGDTSALILTRDDGKKFVKLYGRYWPNGGLVQVVRALDIPFRLATAEDDRRQTPWLFRHPFLGAFAIVGGSIILLLGALAVYFPLAERQEERGEAAAEQAWDDRVAAQTAELKEQWRAFVDRSAPLPAGLELQDHPSSVGSYEEGRMHISGFAEYETPVAEPDAEVVIEAITAICRFNPKVDLPTDVNAYLSGLSGPVGPDGVRLFRRAVSHACVAPVDPLTEWMRRLNAHPLPELDWLDISSRMDGLTLGASIDSIDDAAFLDARNRLCAARVGAHDQVAVHASTDAKIRAVEGLDCDDESGALSAWRDSTVAR